MESSSHMPVHPIGQWHCASADVPIIFCLPSSRDKSCRSRNPVCTVGMLFDDKLSRQTKKILFVNKI
jgi:hypothetical protein